MQVRQYEKIHTVFLLLKFYIKNNHPSYKRVVIKKIYSWVPILYQVLVRKARITVFQVLQKRVEEERE